MLGSDVLVCNLISICLNKAYLGAVEPRVNNRHWRLAGLNILPDKLNPICNFSVEFRYEGLRSFGQSLYNVVPS